MKITFIVSGQSCEHELEPGETLSTVLDRVLQATGNTGQHRVNWEMRRLNGQMLALWETAADQEIAQGDVLYLNPAAGIGAARAS